jgi:uncharacterized protein YjbI with pentapeptide repeats
LLILLPSAVHAAIYRWDNGSVISGTEGISAEPGVQLDSRGLAFANFDALNLSNANFELSDLTNARFLSSILAGAKLSGANLKNAYLKGEGLASAIFNGTTVYNQWTVFPGGFDPASLGLTYLQSLRGDLDGNGELTGSDVDLLSQRLRDPGFMDWQSSLFDLNGDSTIDRRDLETWVDDVRATWFGDANLDGEFNSTDLIQVFQAGQYEDSFEDNSSWATGDWDADGDFTTSDLVAAFQDGGYEHGRRAAVADTPEPASWACWLILSLGSAGACRVRAGDDLSRR